MPIIRFTDLTIRSLTEGLYFDERTPAFGIRVGKRRKTWLVLKGARSAKVIIGHWPLSLADARRKALIAIGSPHRPPSAPSFIQARAEYLAQGLEKQS